MNVPTMTVPAVNAPTIELAFALPLAHFTLDVELASRARAIGVFGASGAGKTSLLEAIAGWRKPTRGYLRVEGRGLFDHARDLDVPARARGIGYVPQDALLFPHLDVAANLRAHARPAGSAGELGADVEERAIDVLGLTRLLARDVRSLSGGERQRVALARALCSRPRLLLLDEPLGAVDVALRRRILPWLLRLREAFDVPLVFVSHDATEVQVLCDEVLVLDEGRAVAHGPAAATLRARQSPGERFENVLRGVVVSHAHGVARIELAPGACVSAAIAHAADGEDVRVVLDADDVLLATQPPTGLSARNVLAARIAAIRSASGAARVDLELAGGERLSANVTDEALRELGLAEGAHVHAVFKSSSCRALAASVAESRAES